MFDADGPATGHYEVAGEELTTNAKVTATLVTQTTPLPC